jgi:hypothetical protein
VKPGKTALRGVAVYVPPLVPVVFIVQLVGASPVTRTGVTVPLKFANTASLVFTPMPVFAAGKFAEYPACGMARDPTCGSEQRAQTC